MPGLFFFGELGQARPGSAAASDVYKRQANDAPDRDPSTFILSGSNDGGATFAEIAAGDVPAFSERFERVEVSFDNSVAYTTYQVTFPTTAGPSTCLLYTSPSPRDA